VAKLDAIVGNMRATKHRIQAALSNLKHIQWRRVHDPEGDSGPFMIAMLDASETAQRLAREGQARGMTCSHLPAYGLHIYYNLKSLVEKRSNCTDGFPWTHPANQSLVRDYSKGTLPRTDEYLNRGVVFAVPSKLTPEQEQDYIEAFKEACEATGI
jgi:8-amino-3,8-dideoxy-alpha-D-manno-octulosonate transaminase